MGQSFITPFCRQVLARRTSPYRAGVGFWVGEVGVGNAGGKQNEAWMQSMHYASATKNKRPCSNSKQYWLNRTIAVTRFSRLYFNRYVPIIHEFMPFALFVLPIVTHRWGLISLTIKKKIFNDCRKPYLHIQRYWVMKIKIVWLNSQKYTK